MRVHRSTLMGGAALVVVALSACGGAGDPDDVPTTTGPGTASSSSSPSAPATSPPASPAATTAPPEPAGPPFAEPGGELVREAGASAALTVVDVRVGRHPGFDRVVYELAGQGTPGWRIQYVDEAVDDPSGEPVDVTGDAFLQVLVTGTAYPDDTGHDEFAENLLPAAGAVREVTRPLTFEGITQSFVGLDEQRPLRVALLRDPVRVVVDVRTT
ncbi:AMIN-like domain-containing (lipo)protein [Cellulomonas gilvus]|nr:hypothetical protein [Cellulomonas gilvus]